MSAGKTGVTDMHGCKHSLYLICSNFFMNSVLIVTVLPESLWAFVWEMFKFVIPVREMLREEHRLRVFENRVLRRIFVPKRDEVTG
jgi:hypothetical protein